MTVQCKYNKLRGERPCFYQLRLSLQSWAFSRDFLDGKSKYLLLPGTGGVGGMVINDWCINSYQ